MGAGNWDNIDFGSEGAGAGHWDIHSHVVGALVNGLLSNRDTWAPAGKGQSEGPRWGQSTWGQRVGPQWLTRIFFGLKKGPRG